MLHRYLGLASLATLGVLLAACGANPLNSSEKTPEIAVTQTDADIASDCWSIDDRSSEGSDNVPNHQQWSTPPEMQIDPAVRYVATMRTSQGSFEIELLASEAPKTVNNFICLAKAGYFNNTPFHRIMSGFVIQGGDPTGTGTGGPGYRFEDEPVTLDYVKGSVAMANAGPNTNGSQFFVVLDDLRGKLPKNYTIFGQVISGMDVVDTLGQTPTKTNARGEKSVPVETVTLESVTIAEG